MLQEFKNRVENGFENHAYFVYDNYKKIIPAIALTIILLVLNLYNIKIDVSTEGFLYKDDPNRVAYTKLRDQFGRDEKIIIAIKSDHIFSDKFLNNLKSLQDELEDKVPYLKDILSLINATKTTGNNDSLIVEELFKKFPIDKDDIAKAKTYIKSSYMFEDLLLSKDNKWTTIIITAQTYEPTNDTLNELEDDFEDDIVEQKREYLSDFKSSQMISVIKKILKKYQNNDFKTHLVGMTSFTDTLKYELVYSMLFFVALLLFGIVSLLTFFFRRKVGVMLSMMSVGLSIISTISLMAIFGVPLSSMSGILPSFILSIGIGDSVHLLSIFFREFDKTKNKRESIAYALSHSGLAIVLTTLATAISLLSFSVSDIPPAAFLGIFAAIGALMAMLLTILLIPSLLAHFDIKPKTSMLKTHNNLDIFLEKIAKFSLKNSKIIVIVSFVLIAITLYLSSTLKYKHDPLEWVPKDNEFRINTAIVDKALRGSMSLEIVIDTHKKNGLYNPKFLKALEELESDILDFKSDKYFVGKTLSITSIIKEINRALHENNNKYYTIPTDKTLIAEEFLLFENSSDDLEQIVDNNFRKTKITIRMPWIDAVTYRPFLITLQKMVDSHLGDYSTSVITGIIPMMVKTVNSSLKSTFNSYIISYGFIAVLMILLLGDIKLGLVSMIPNIAPVIVGLSAMLIFKMNLDMFTILIGAIAIGLAVDDTIHFMHNFKRYYFELKDTKRAVEETFYTTGKAMVITSIVLSLGFYVYMFASLTNLINFGILAGGAITIALFSNIILGPALLTLITKDKK